jgi:hypothetical protein
MDEQTKEEGLKHLEHIEEELEQINKRISPQRPPFAYGLFQGAGALVGGILMLAILGWVLSLFGVIPGLAAIAAYFQNIVNHFHQ